MRVTSRAGAATAATPVATKPRLGGHATGPAQRTGGSRLRACRRQKRRAPGRPPPKVDYSLASVLGAVAATEANISIRDLAEHPGRAHAVVMDGTVWNPPDVDRHDPNMRVESAPGHTGPRLFSVFAQKGVSPPARRTAASRSNTDASPYATRRMSSIVK